MNLPTHVELRSLEAEVRMADGPNGKPVIRGYAAVFNSRSQILRTESGQRFTETIKPGAFTRSLAEGDLRSYFNHDPNQVLGRRSAGTLRVGQDDRGLWYEVDPPDTGYARDLLELMKRGDVRGSSFQFATIEDDWQDGEGDVLCRELRSAHVFEVGPVVNPAYRSATASLRSLDAYLEARSARSAPAVTYPTPEQVALLNKLRLAELA